jgi:hypothetical protein
MLMLHMIRYFLSVGMNFGYLLAEILRIHAETDLKMCELTNRKLSYRSEWWQTLRQVAIFYILLTALVIPSAICSQQDHLPVYNPTPDELHAMLDISTFWGGIDLAAVGQGKAESPSQSQFVKAPPFHDIILQAAREYDVDAALIRAIIMAESSYNPRAVSHRGAQGLMQLMPTTAKWLGVKDSFNPEANIDAGVRYFRRLLDRFDGDVELALAAYNAGSRYVKKYKGVPPFKATRKYIRKVMEYHQRFSDEMALYEVNPSAV